MLAVTQVEDPTFGRRCGGGEQQCLDYIVNEIEVATLASIAEDLNRFAFNEVTNPNAQESLTPIFDAHAGTVGIGQAQRARPNLVSAVVKQVIPFAGQFVDSIHVDRINGMLFIHRQILRPTVKLAGAGKNYFDTRIVQPAGFQDRQLRSGVDIQIGQGIGH